MHALARARAAHHEFEPIFNEREVGLGLIGLAQR
jgi:hypothetical protein